VLLHEAVSPTAAKDPWQHGGKTVADRVSPLRTRA
jgi:hypothetical protein